MVHSSMPLLLSGFALFEFQVVFKIVENYGLLSMTINQYIKALFSKNGMEYSRLVCGRFIVPARHCCVLRSCFYNLLRFALNLKWTEVSMDKQPTNMQPTLDRSCCMLCQVH